MSKKKPSAPRLNPIDVSELSTEAKLQRIRYLSDEIACTKATLKHQTDSAKDYIGECQEQIDALLEETPPEQHQGSVSQSGE